MRLSALQSSHGFPLQAVLQSDKFTFIAHSAIQPAALVCVFDPGVAYEFEPVEKKLIQDLRAIPVASDERVRTPAS